MKIKNLALSGLMIVAVIFVLFKVLSSDVQAPLPDDFIQKEKAVEIVKDILGENEDGHFAYLWTEVLVKGDEVGVWGEGLDEDDDGEDTPIEATKIEKFTWLAWIDKDPGNVFFGHETEFIYIDAESGNYETTTADFWPTINEESFEGDIDNMVNPEELEGENNLALKFLNTDAIKNFFAIEAKAHDAGKNLHINPPKVKYEHEHYALIVAGFGRNDWVFLEGAHEMYKALKAAGYDDDHIVFLAPINGALNPEWDREAQFDRKKAKEMYDKKITKYIPSSAVDGATSPMNFRLSVEGIQKKMTEKDSLFVFMLAHGKKSQKFALGKPVSKRESMGAVNKIKGSSAGLTSKRFSEVLVGRGKACEIMVLIDSCYAGKHEPKLRSYFEKNKDNIMRMQVAHSSSDTISYGADYKKPTNPKRKIKESTDVSATNTPTADTNPDDHGGEFSSGFITNLGSQIFSVIYEKGVALDAAKVNKLTTPYIWKIGKDDPCVMLEDAGIADEEDPMTDPEEEVEDESEPESEPAPLEEPVGKNISVVPYGDSYIPVEQLKPYSKDECSCCDADHWHAVSGKVTTLDGKVISDPYASCGLGKVSDMPVMEINVKE